MPPVSVIMNVRNGASTLREALDSVMAQTFTDWELIVWDDRSTDDSAKIVAEYSDPEFAISCHRKKLRLAKRRNAIRQARGEWLAFLDQDDVWMPHKLEMQLALARGAAWVSSTGDRQVLSNGTERDYDQAHEFKPLPEGDIFVELFTKSVSSP